MSERWTRIEPTEVTRVGWRTVVTKHFRLPDGSEIAFDTLGREGQNDTAVIALTPENKVVIAKIFRAGPEEVMSELPGGLVDDGEDAKTSGLRELVEETGYEPTESSQVVELGSVPLQDAYSNIRKNYFLVTDVVQKHEQKLEVEETISVDTISIGQLIANAKEGRMSDGIAVLLAYDRLRDIEKEG